MTREAGRPKKSLRNTLVLDKDARGKLSGVTLNAPCPKCGKVQEVYVGEAAIGHRSTVQADCFDKYEPVLAVFEVGDYVRLKHYPDKPIFQINEIDENGSIGHATWWPDALWRNEQVEHVSPSKRPPPPCKNKWKIEVQLDLTIKQSS